MASLQLLRLLLRSVRFRSISFISSSPIQPPPHSSHQLPSNFSSHFQHSTIFAPPSLFQTKFFSLESESEPVSPTQSLSEELESDPNSVAQRLQLSFSHITLTPSLVLQTLNLSLEAGRTVLGFHQWLASNPKFSHTDETLYYFVDYFGRRKDFKATNKVLASGGAGSKTLLAAIDRLIRAGRPSQVIQFFERMEKDYGLKRDRSSLKVVVEKLCLKGYASYAEKMTKDLAKEFFPDEAMCDLLVTGYCIDGKIEEARRLAGEMYRGGFELGVGAYNAMLDCVCKICRQKDPFKLNSESEKVLVEMDHHGVPRNVETFNVLITNLCKIRKTDAALGLFFSMQGWRCNPNETTFLFLIKSLYQAARLEEGDGMIDGMKSSGFGAFLDKKAYFDFLTILCGIERIDHALKIFAMMKADGCEPGVKTYDLLMKKLGAHDRVDKANALFYEARGRGLDVTPKEYVVDPRFVRKKEKKVKGEISRPCKLVTKSKDPVNKEKNVEEVNISPVSFTFSALFSSLKTPTLGSQLHVHALLFVFVSDLYVSNTVIDMYVKCGLLSSACKVFDEMTHRDAVSWTELIVAYSKSGDMDSARELFDGLPGKDKVAWTSMVIGYAQNAMPKKALEFFRWLREASVETDEITLVGVISACAQLGVSGYANWIRGIAKSSKFGSANNVLVGSALIDMYSKCGNVEEAYNVFKGMKEKNVFSYSYMIVGFAAHGCARAAVKLFYEMLENGIRPNHVTFVGVLTACSHASMVEQGQHLFGAMEECYGVAPTADHYACMADLLGRAGQLDKALRLVQTMPMESNGGVWGALLGASHIHRNPDVAEIASHHLFELEPDNLGNYLS